MSGGALRGRRSARRRYLDSALSQPRSDGTGVCMPHGFLLRDLALLHQLHQRPLKGDHPLFGLRFDPGLDLLPDAVADQVAHGGCILEHLHGQTAALFHPCA